MIQSERSPTLDPMTLAPLTLLDHCLSAFRRGQIAAALTRLRSGLEQYRMQLGGEAWRHFTRTSCQSHPLWNALGQDPTVRISRLPTLFQEGRPGWLDAMQSPDASSDYDSQPIAEFLAASPLATALRNRQDYRSQELNRLESTIARPRVLATDPGSGPSRKNDRDQIHHVFLGTPPGSPHLPPGHPRQHECLAHLEKTLQTPGMKHSHDLVHALDALDNVDDATARKLVPMLFALLAPGGRLILSSFAPGLPDRAYIESFMDLWFAYRDEDRLWNLGFEISRAEINATHLSRDSDGLIVRLEIVKR